MSEPESEETAVAAEGDSAESPTKLGGKKNRRRRSVVALVAAGAVIALLQWLASKPWMPPKYDQSVANIVSISIGLTIAIYIAYQAHRGAEAAGHRWRVPAVVAVSLIGLLILFEPDGFSGEMMPQFRFRFGDRFEWKDIQSSQAVGAQETDAGRALMDSPQFLGPNRNALIAERQFSVPKSAEDLEVLWDEGIGQGWASFAVAGDRAVTLEQRDELECVTCYRLADGELLWMRSHDAFHYNALGGGGPRSTPTIVGHKVFAQGATGHVWCLHLDSGDVVWEIDLLKLANWTKDESEAAISWGRAASPLIVDDLCVVPFGTLVDPNDPDKGERSLIALDVKTGDVRWRAGSDQISYASPIVMELAGQRQIVSVNEKTITGHLIEDGKFLWSLEWPGSSTSSASCTMPVPAGQDRFLIGKSYGGGSALVEISKVAKGEFEAKEVWKSTRVLETKFTHSCVDGDVVYALGDGWLQAVSLADGQRLWMQPRSARFGQGQILLVDDVIVAQTEAGDVVFVAANPDKYEELFRLPALSSKTWNIPTIAGRHLLVRNDRQTICYLLPK